MALPAPCYLEDFVVGERFNSHSLIVAEAEIIEFAKKYDPQPFHTDPIKAVDTVLHGLAASGWHTAAMSMSLFVACGPKPAGGLLGAGVELLEWPTPVRPGDVLHLEAEVIAIRESRSKPAGIVTVRSQTFNQHGQPVQIFQPKLFIPKRPQAERDS